MNVRYAAIIAGGASRRMGTTKALLDVEDRPLITHVAEVLRAVLPEVFVVTSSSEIADAAGASAVADVFPGKGPLAGIHAAIRHTGEPVFCCACDMPSLHAGFIRHLCEQLEEYDAVVPRNGGYEEPLHAVYTPSCLSAIEQELAKERVGPVNTIFRDLRVRWVEEEEARRFDPQVKMFENWNTPDEVKQSIAGGE